MPAYPLRDINERLKRLGAYPLERDGRGDFQTTYKGVRVAGITVTHPGNEVPDYSVNKIAKRFVEIAGYKSGKDPYDSNLRKLKSFLKGRASDDSDLEKLLEDLEKERVKNLGAQKIMRLGISAAVFIWGVFLIFIALKGNFFSGMLIFENARSFVLGIWAIFILGVVVFLVWRILRRKRKNKK